MRCSHSRIKPVDTETKETEIEWLQHSNQSVLLQQFISVQREGDLALSDDILDVLESMVQGILQPLRFLDH